MHKFPGFIVLLSLTAMLSACSLSLAGDITPPPGSEQKPAQQTTQSVSSSPIYPIVPPDPAKGALIYNQECAPCHGTKGQGDGPQAAQLSVPVATLGLTDFARHYSPAEWYTVVTQGDMQHYMPAFSDLTDRQRWDVVAYAMSLSISDELISQGKEIFQGNCVRCHGQSGKGDGADSASLSTKPRNLTDQALMAQNSATSLEEVITTGVTPDMPAFGDILKENERWALVAYLRDLTYAKSTSAGAYPAPGTNEGLAAGSTAYPAPQAYPEPAVEQSPVLTTTAPISSTEPFTGTVTVQLINGSGGDAPSDASVTIYGFDNMQNTYSETLTTGADGIYMFSDVYMPEGRVFLAGVDYDSGTYGSDIISVDPNTPDLTLEITVYDSTTDISALTTDRVHIFFDFTDPQITQVIEVFIISNSSNLAVVPPTPEGTVVTFPLPEGYQNLQFQDGELGDRYVEVDQGFADRMTVNPGVGGEYQVIFAFNLPYNRKLEFSQPMFLPTNAVTIMVPESGLKVESDLLNDGGTRDFQGSTYHMYDGGSLLAGSSIEFTLSGKPKNAAASFLSTGTVQNLAIGLGVFGLALVAAGLWLYRQNQLKAARQLSSAGEDLAMPGSMLEGMPEDEDTLMDAIITLDDQYHEGNLPEDAYLKRRAALKDKLREISQG